MSGGGGSHAGFGKKLLNSQRGMGTCARKSPILKWANALSLKKNSPKPNAAPHNNASWSQMQIGY